MAKKIFEAKEGFKKITLDEMMEFIEAHYPDDEEWFETITDPVSDKIVSVDNQKCYECTRNGTSEIWYVTVDKGRHSPYNGYHDVYNSAKTHQTYSNFSKNGDAIACNWNFTVNKNPAKTHVEPKKFADISHSTLQKIFTKNNS